MCKDGKDNEMTPTDELMARKAEREKEILEQERKMCNTMQQVEVLEREAVAKMNDDAWIHRSSKMRCGTCMFFVEKAGGSSIIGRCRRHAPTLSGWPAIFGDRDWCGDHKLDETKI